MHLGPDSLILSEDQGSPKTPLPPSFSSLLQVASYLPGRNLYTYLCPSFCGCHLRGRHPNCLVLIANRTYIHVANKEVLKRLKSTPWPQSYTPGPSAEGVGKNTQLPFLSGRCLSTYFPSCCLRAQLPTSLHVGAVIISFGTLSSWHTFNYWEVLGTKKVAWTITKVTGA